MTARRDITTAQLKSTPRKRHLTTLWWHEEWAIVRTTVFRGRATGALRRTHLGDLPVGIAWGSTRRSNLWCIEQVYV
jgi:hypothetical protein